MNLVKFYTRIRKHQKTHHPRLHLMGVIPEKSDPHKGLSKLLHRVSLRSPLSVKCVIPCNDNGAAGSCPELEMTPFSMSSKFNFFITPMSLCIYLLSSFARWWWEWWEQFRHRVELSLVFHARLISIAACPFTRGHANYNRINDVPCVCMHLALLWQAFI